MKVSKYLLLKLKENGVTDIFGIPGSVILDLIYEADSDESITPHLCYHEQTAAYAACGFASVSGKLGAAYATKGPGVTNMITAIAEAYCDSIPVVFITAHSQTTLNTALRIAGEQELDHLSLVSNITKFSKRIDKTSDAKEAIDTAVMIANDGRSGPVFLDFYSKIFSEDIYSDDTGDQMASEFDDLTICDEIIDYISECLSRFSRPIILIGDGIRSSSMEADMLDLAHKLRIPVLSSRFSQDILNGCDSYFGYIGSHGLRYSNMILHKADLIISLGNRLEYNINSKSFEPIARNAHIIRIDCDNNELNKYLPGSKCFCNDLRVLLPYMTEKADLFRVFPEWINQCQYIKQRLELYDVYPAISMLSKLINNSSCSAVVCDIGNNELHVSKAYSMCSVKPQLLHSKNMKTVGSSIGKAIGAYYVSHQPILCITGDQGLQFNIQELQYISSFKLPVSVIICNNSESGMLKQSEISKRYSYLLHTTIDTGYSHPEFSKIADCYGISYYYIDSESFDYNSLDFSSPQIIEISTGSDDKLIPKLPVGNLCYEFLPEVDKELISHLEKI